ncbi:peroxisomal multifunctional enzyme type 2, putative [Eimeria maxima]|uniref:Peroxisomal multifunctional enzyme type 2, putative n=1 Tax=Eimeria maxima TaxID=5804 RepID=U6M8C4_EIMMA|nr:peroxisomal multifunctional enzyme type 2, putative [Eimeria maxima]CDJ57920.1 peroxisomal multifunctional enzyme type 2, putative [Eimeria maxima]
MERQFDGQVAVITGAGGGLGRAYAIAFSKRGAKVVVNDLGVALAGDAQGEGIRAADAVVNEIRKAGGVAIANYDDVLNGSKIIEAAIRAFGRIDILVNNAGILRDSSFAKMTEQDWDRVMQVHVKGAFACTKAAWPHMLRQKYGRIINTASASGLYGNFGQTNYSTAKMALVGMSKTLAAEGVKYNIHVNCIAPLAGTRMTAGVLPPQVREALKPECVAPVVLYLCSKECKETGQVFEVGAGWVAAVRWQRSPGKVFPSSYTLEDLTRDWQQVMNFGTNVSYPTSLQDSLVMASQQMSAGTNQQQHKQQQQDHHDHQQEEEEKKKDNLSLNSLKIFRIISAFLDRAKEEKNKLKENVNSSFHFEVSPKQGQPVSIKWTIDLRADGEGRAMEGLHGTADATFIMADEVFTSICLGKLNPQVAFLQGKMKLRGNMGKATKFTPDLFPPITDDYLSLSPTEAVNKFIKELKLPSGESTGKEEEGKGQEKEEEKPPHILSKAASKLQSARLFPFLIDHLKSPAGAQLVKQVGCVYRVDLLPSKKGEEDIPCTFYINLKEMPPTVRETSNACKDKYDCCFTLNDDIFYKLATGKINPQMAFLQGKMKIKGSTKAAMKFTRDMFPKISKL